MATTRLISIHQNKGKCIADCLADRTDYAQNPDKTADELFSAYLLVGFLVPIPMGYVM